MSQKKKEAFLSLTTFYTLAGFLQKSLNIKSPSTTLK